jgi:DNA-directed RNA polymerase specialized sigma subunit
MSELSSKGFKLFANNLAVALEKFKVDGDQTPLLEIQRQQLRDLLVLEETFKNALIKSPLGSEIYKKFIDYICDVKGNILSARPYFRERQKIFTKTISGAIKNRDYKTLYQFRINYSFILFVSNNFAFPEKSKILKYIKQIKQLRSNICEQSLALAISQAKIFYSCTPRSHLSWMDLVQIHCAGLLIAIDKFVPPDTTNMTDEESLQAYRKFRAVAIGRMIAGRIQNYSETLIHFYPNDRAKIYRANKLIRSFGGNVDFEKLATLVNSDVEVVSQRTNARELEGLLAGASTISGDSTVEPVFGSAPLSTLELYEVDVESRFDSVVEQNQALSLMRTCITELPVVHQKILKMRGV